MLDSFDSMDGGGLPKGGPFKNEKEVAQTAHLEQAITNLEKEVSMAKKASPAFASTQVGHNFVFS